MAEIAVDANVDLGVLALEFGKDVRKQVEAGGLVGAKYDGTLNDVAAIGNYLDGFVAQAEQALRIVEENFTGRGQFDGLGGAIQELGAISLFELADLGANGRL